MTRPYGRGPRGERVMDSVPAGHWKITTFVCGYLPQKFLSPSGDAICELSVKFVHSSSTKRTIGGGPAPLFRGTEWRPDTSLLHIPS